MQIYFILLFTFAFGCIFGWTLELFYRRITSKSKHWINPGFLVGPYLPIYGFGVSVMYIIANLEKYIILNSPFAKSLILFVAIGMAMTAIEYIAGIIFIKGMKIKLWDYSGMWGNLQGIICPLYSFFWTLLGALYYYTLHPYITDIINTAFKSPFTYFALGMFYGIFVIDFAYSVNLIAKIKKFAEEQQIVVKLEELKSNIIKTNDEIKKKSKFFLILSAENTLSRNLKHYHAEIKKIQNDVMNKIHEGRNQ